MVLDLDETLIHSHHDKLAYSFTLETISIPPSLPSLSLRPPSLVLLSPSPSLHPSLPLYSSTIPPATDMLPDFYVRVYIENHPVKFYVYKRPHVDYFLSVVRLTV